MTHTETKKMAALLITDAAAETNPNFNPDRLPKPGLKCKPILRALLNGDLNRFNAERAFRAGWRASGKQAGNPAQLGKTALPVRSRAKREI